MLSTDVLRNALTCSHGDHVSFLTSSYDGNTARAILASLSSFLIHRCKKKKKKGEGGYFYIQSSVYLNLNSYCATFFQQKTYNL